MGDVSTEGALTPTAARLLESSQRIVLIEDDPGDAMLVQDMLHEVEPDLNVVWAKSIAEAGALLAAPTSCVLLDLQLPDAVEFSGLDTVLAAAPHAAVIVLTGFTDEWRGVTALARGAQDYLNKSQVEPNLLARAIRYAIERRAAEETVRQLAQAHVRAEENTRLERGLLPVPLLTQGGLGFHARYRPGRDRALLGGDFYDVVECPDGTAFALIGDVCGHGPDEAALGVCLRVAWRTLILAGTAEEDILPTVARMLVAERASEEIFATACMVRIAADRRSARVQLAGHPPPILLGRAGDEPVTGPPLGVLPDCSWDSVEVALPARWTLVLHTDGLIEGGAGQDSAERLGEDGLLALLADLDTAGAPPPHWMDQLIERVIDRNGGPLADDLALLVLHAGRPR